MIAPNVIHSLDGKYVRELFEQYGDDDGPEVEATHAVADYHGIDLAYTPIDKLFANQALGFATAGAMHGG